MSTITLYSYAYCPFSHRCRIVLCEKDMPAEIREVNILDKPEELAHYNPYNQVPVLVDRDLHLYESNVICEYLDDRFPYPQLMPADIMVRARVRLLLFQIESEIAPHIKILAERGDHETKQVERARKLIGELLTQLSGLISKNTQYLVDKEFTMIDIALAPLLWRLSHYKIKLPPAAQKPLLRYSERVFARQSFIDSLTIGEKKMRP